MTARTHLEAVFSERRACGKVFLTAYRASHLRKVIMTTKTLTRVIIARDVGTAALRHQKTVAGSTQVARRLSESSLIAVLIAGLAWHLWGYAQDKPKPSSKVPSENSNVSCYDEGTGKLVGPNRRRTFVLGSPDGKYLAYAETEAFTRKRGNARDNEDVECENASRLFVAGPWNHKFRQVMTVFPKSEPEPSANDIALVDWSPKGHRLLIVEGLWSYGSDFGGSVIRIYDADSGKLSSESFVEDAFRKHAGKDCIGVFQPLGFSEDGGIVVKAGPYFDVGEEQPREDSCVPKQRLWLIEPPQDAIKQLPEGYKPKHYGKEAPRGVAR
jgi:dipeptidyl aminopeptidase/acylaminoacyl peptidase